MPTVTCSCSVTRVILALPQAAAQGAQGAAGGGLQRWRRRRAARARGAGSSDVGGVPVARGLGRSAGRRPGSGRRSRPPGAARHVREALLGAVVPPGAGDGVDDVVDVLARALEPQGPGERWRCARSGPTAPSGIVTDSRPRTWLFASRVSLRRVSRLGCPARRSDQPPGRRGTPSWRQVGAGSARAARRRTPRAACGRRGGRPPAAGGAGRPCWAQSPSSTTSRSATLPVSSPSTV